MTDHIRYDDARGCLVLLDQRILPTREEYFDCTDTASTIYALQTMVVRGAPAIGVTAAYGCRLALDEVGDGPGWQERLQAKLAELAAARPTAVNLKWAVDLMTALWKDSGEVTPARLADIWLARAKELHAEDIEINKAMGRHGGALMRDGDTIMTHCNAGALATAGWGTALGVIRGALELGRKVRVIANETRPFLQGARLTAYELAKDGIDVTVACDNAVGLLMQRGMVQQVVVGADRVAANGDAANKIGTFTVAVMAKRFGVPFYVAAPLSTIDRNTPTGADIPIEDRTPDEVVFVGATRITPEGVPVYNFAFDVTPGDELIAGIITEKGVLRPPYAASIRRVFAEGAA
ncbi:MAG: S-methyl-5-thioribose-1-phosphate isomerase [Desulfovibrionaceae bacterium]|jgi:methylthioribose-1-phosphate isomerase|nr:S-methyl-5-thioribose-1-phosphate isomerase [Desulfovibrionaceae bacterium]